MRRTPSFAPSGPLRRSPAHRVLPLAVLFGVALPAHAQGQVVRGRLVAAEEERGIGGAMVEAVSLAGIAVGVRDR